MRLCLGALLVALLMPAAAYAKPGDGIPSWVAGSEKQMIARDFGGAHPVLIAHIGYPNKVAVVFEFQDSVVCGFCSSPVTPSNVRARVFRVSFDRKTHLFTGSARLCEARGSWPPLSRCLAR